VSDRYQVANVNTLLAAKATWAALTSTNTAIRTYVDTSVAAVVNSAPGTLNTLYELAAALSNDPSFATSTAALIATKISVANAAATYLTKNNPVVTGTLTPDTRIEWTAAGTGAPAFTTRNSGTKIVLYPTITGSQTDYALGINSGVLWSSLPGYDGGQYFKWYGGTTEVASLSGTGILTVAAISANSSTGTAGYYLRSSGSGIYWSPVAAGGGSAANGFSGILVGANVVSADSTTDRLTLVAGSGIAIAANPATDTITFTATGGGGSFTGGTISGATTVTDATASTSNLTGAFKVTGGVGVTGNIYTAGRVGYASNTTSGTSAVYTYYNSAAGSLDTVFG
jgi:hypothetical protein